MKNMNDIFVSLSSAQMLRAGATPVALKLAQRGGIGASVDRLVAWDQTECAVSPGVLAETLVAAILCGHNPLTKLRDFWEGRECEPYFAAHGVRPEQLDDAAYGHLLDRIAEDRGRSLVEAVALRYLVAHGMDAQLVHVSTASVSVGYDDGSEGDEDAGGPWEDEEIALLLAFGHRRFKQTPYDPDDVDRWKIGLGVQQNGMPLTGKLLAGNVSDRAWSLDVARYAAHTLAAQGLGHAVFVEDSALGAKGSLKNLVEEGLDFMSILPGAFALEKELRDEAWHEDAWTTLEPFGQEPQALQYQYWHTRRELVGEVLDFLVVTSSHPGERKEKILKTRFFELGEELKQEARALAEQEFAGEEEARRALERLKESGSTKGFQVSGQIRKSGALPEIGGTWRAVVSVGEVGEETYARARRQESTFVLAYRLKKNPAMNSPAEVLKAYKSQEMAEQGFRFLKQPVVLGPEFQKTPERITALGYLFILPLILSQYLEYCVWTGLEKEGTMLILGGKKVFRPTTKIILECLDRVMILQAEGQRFLTYGPQDNVMKILRALDVPSEVYTGRDSEDHVVR